MDGDPGTGGDRGSGSLTASERETLRRALELGYFAVPREASLAELAADLDRSDVAVSRELRRGVGAVLRETDVVDSPE